MDKRKNNGGARENSGRLKKDELFQLIETMDAIAIPQEIFIKLMDKIESTGDIKAIELWLKYRLGMPKQMMDITSMGEKIQNVINLGSGINPNEVTD
jgi:hypothetical protein